LDVIHCEQKIVKNILKIVTFSEKDMVEVKHDLQCKSMKQHIWLTINVKKGG
jgi:hypothetical protein